MYRKKQKWERNKEIKSYTERKKEGKKERKDERVTKKERKTCVSAV